MNNTESLSHSKWECKYHVVWIPKCRRKALYEQLRKNLEKYSMNLRDRRKAKCLRVICNRIMSIC